jgi:hypothetical protein
MRDWFVLDVGLSLTPVALVWLGSALVGRWSGWAGPLRDGQLCFFATALAAVTIRDVIGLGRASEAADALARLARVIDRDRGLATCEPLVQAVDVGPAAVSRCLQPAPDIWLPVVCLILCLLLATFVFGAVVTESTRRAGPHAEENRPSLVFASIATAAVTAGTVAAVRVTMGVWP